jgi:serine/threonine protein kinase
VPRIECVALTSCTFSYRYHAPEVVSSLLYTFKSDVWSIGCIMWEVIALRPPSKEPINLQNIDLSLIPKVYGSATRDLLLLHLQHLDHRPSVSAIKKAMLSNLASAGRQLVQSVADASASMQHASEREASALMAPRHVAAPLKISDAASRDANGQSSAVVGPGLSGDKVKIASTSSHGGGHNPSPVVGQKSISDSSDASGGLGIHLAAGEGGEYGAWKIVLLPPGKPAALSGDVSIGDYLWEVR